MKLNKRQLELVRELKAHGPSCSIWNMTFAPIPGRYKEQMEAELKYQFDLWWRSWILPKLELLEGCTCDGKPELNIDCPVHGIPNTQPEWKEAK